MNRATRNKLASGTDQSNLTAGNACWETPHEVFNKLNNDFGPFDVDLCANAGNNKLPVFLGPGSTYWEDALTADWHQFGFDGFANPPYGAFVQQLLPWATAQARLGFSSTHLLPLRVTKAFREYVLKHASELFFCDKRIVFFENGLPRVSFDKRGKPRADTALFDSIIVRFTPNGGRNLHVGEWHVPQHVTKAQIEMAASLAHKVAA